MFYINRKRTFTVYLEAEKSTNRQTWRSGSCIRSISFAQRDDCIKLSRLWTAQSFSHLLSYVWSDLKRKVQRTETTFYVVSAYWVYNQVSAVSEQRHWSWWCHQATFFSGWSIDADHTSSVFRYSLFSFVVSFFPHFLSQIKSLMGQMVVYAFFMYHWILHWNNCKAQQLLGSPTDDTSAN